MMETNKTPILSRLHPDRQGRVGGSPIARSRPLSVRRQLLVILLSLLLACAGGGGDVADTGGMSGTGVSQGSVSSFGSIFVNGIEWEIGSASIDLDGTPATESALRLGMVVRVEGDFEVTGTTGTARSVVFDDAIEGPLENDPVDVTPGGLERTFVVLGTSIIVHEQTTVYAGGATFLDLARDDVVEVSGFVDNNGAIRATRVTGKGRFPGNSEVELRGSILNLVKNADGSGSFDLGSILVRYASTTTFFDVTRGELSDDQTVEVRGTVRLVGDEVDADEIELESSGLGSGSAEQAEIEGFVSNRVSNSSFVVSGTPIDASGAIFDPPGLVVMNGAFVEVEGSLQDGTLVAERVELESENDDVKLDARVGGIDRPGRILLILGISVSVDAETVLKDDRDDDENFEFDEIQIGDWLEIRGIRTGPAIIRALRVERDEDRSDVELEGPVTSIDANAPSISVVDTAIPLDSGTLFIDENGQIRSEEEFFRNPGDVGLGDIVKAVDIDAVDLSVLAEADEVEIEDQ